MSSHSTARHRYPRRSNIIFNYTEKETCWSESTSLSSLSVESSLSTIDKQQLESTIRRSASPEPESEDEVGMAGKSTRKTSSQGVGENRSGKRLRTGRATESASDRGEIDREGLAAAEKVSKRELHVDIMLEARDFDTSSVIIQVGIINPQPITVHKIFLALHSDFFARALENVKVKQEYINPEATDGVNFTIPSRTTTPTFDDKSMIILLDDVVKSDFGAFLNWIYSGKFRLSSLSAESQPFGSGRGVALISLWVLGRKLEAPGFQNFIVDELRSVLAMTERSFFTTSQVRAIYSATASDTAAEKTCILRKFTAHCVAAYQPFQKNEGDLYACGEWETLFREWPELSMEVLKARGKGWGETKMPWDEEMKGEYQVKELPLKERWEAIKRSEPHQ